MNGDSSRLFAGALRSCIFFLLSCAGVPVQAGRGSDAVLDAMSIPIEFVLFALTLLGVALFHHHTLRVALVGLASAVSLAIGLEMLPYAAMAGAILTLRWVWDRAEAERLARMGVRELTLIGQDTTCYGEDFALQDGLALLLQLAERLLLGREGAAMRLQPHAIQLRDRGDTTRHPPNRSHIVRRQQELHVARASALREFHEAFPDAGRLGDARGLLKPAFIFADIEFVRPSRTNFTRTMSPSLRTMRHVTLSAVIPDQRGTGSSSMVRIRSPGRSPAFSAGESGRR
mgnify:CR=1 FL=1